MDVPDGDLDPDTGHCRAALDGDCAPAAAVSFLWAAGIATTENHLHFEMRTDPTIGTRPAVVMAVLRQVLAATPWTIQSALGLANPPAGSPAFLMGFVRPTGERHMVCVIGGWLHDASEDERIAVTPAQIAAYDPEIVIYLVPAPKVAA